MCHCTIQPDHEISKTAIQRFTLARQVLYHLSHTPVPFALIIFEIGSCFMLRPAWMSIHTILSSHPRKWSQHLLTACCLKINTMFPFSPKKWWLVRIRGLCFFWPPSTSWLFLALVLTHFSSFSIIPDSFSFKWLLSPQPVTMCKSSLFYKTSQEIPWRLPSLVSVLPTL
jgi:hypothetical protein